MKNIRNKVKRQLKKASNFLSTTPKAIVFIFVVYFFQGLITNLGHPVTPAFVSEMGIDNAYFGYYFAAMSFGLLVGSPIWGYLGDKGHKRLYVVVGLLIYSMGQYMFAYVGDKNVMILFRFISGFGISASITLLLSHLIKNSPLDRRKIYLGWYQAILVLGGSTGYFIGGTISTNTFFIDFLHTNDYRIIFLIQSIWMLFHALYIFFVLGKDQPQIKNNDVIQKKPNFIEGFKSIKKMDKNLLLFLISLALISLGTVNVTKFIEVYMNDINLSPADIGNFVGLTGIVSLVATIILVPVIARLKKDFPIMLFIQALSAIIIFIVFRQANIMVALYSGFMIYVVLKALFSPLEQNYISSHAADENLGTIMGVRQSFFSIGLVAGPLLGGWLYDITPLYVFDFSVLMFILGFILILIVGKRIKSENIKIKNLDV